MNFTNEDIVGSLLPNVYISRITLQSTKDDKLIANVQFVLKETYGNDDISSWLEDSEVLKYLKIFVIQSANEEATKLTEGYFDSIEGRPFLENADRFEQYKTSLVNRGILKNRNELAYRQIDLFRLQTEFALRPSIEELEKRGIAERKDNDDGSRTYDIYVDVNFREGLDENPKHLSYIFGTMYDLGSLIGDLVEDASTQAIGAGEILTETVVTNGEVNQTTFIYTDEEGNVWPGPIHIMMKDRKAYYRSGQTESSESFNLIKVEIENNKVQDFREIKRNLDIFRLDLNESILLDAFEQVVFPDELTEKETSSISDGYASFDSRKNTSVSFFIDYKKLFINNSVYGQVLSKINNSKSKAFIDSYYQFGSLESVVLYSKRIDIDDSLAANKQKEVAVAEFYGKSAIQELNKPIILPDVEAKNMQQLHMFSIVDTKTEKQGTHQYFVELEYKDNVVEHISKLILDLKEEQKLFNTYYLNASSPAVFNVTTNRFIKRVFIDSSLVPVKRFDYHGRLFIETAATLFSYDIVELRKLIATISSWLDPNQGTPETFSYVVKLYEQMIDTLENSISAVPFVNNSLNEKGEGAPVTGDRTQSISKTIKIRRNLNTTFDFDSNYTLEYLNSSRSDNTGLGNSTQFLYEVLKTDLISKKVDSTKKLTNVRNANQQNEIVFEKLYDIASDLADIEIKKKLHLPPIAVSDFNRVQDLARAIQPLNPSAINRSDERLNNSLDIIDKKTLNTLLLGLLNPTVDKSSQNVEFIFDSSRVENIFWDIQPELAYTNKSSFTDVLSTNSRNIITDLFKESRMGLDEAKKLPNQLKSLIKFKINSPNVVLGDAEVRFKYEMLKQVKFISGFKYDNKKEVFDLGSPIWKILEGLTALQSKTEGVLFCKLLDYVNPKIKYKFNQALKEACINEFFFINNQQVNEQGSIRTGATQVSVQFFESRCIKELQMFFNGESEPKVDYIIDSKSILSSDSYINTKYSYLSPYGVQFDNKFRVINLHESLIDSDIIIQNPTIGGNIRSRDLPGLSIGLTNDDMVVSATRPRESIVDSQILSKTVRDKLSNTNLSSLAIYTRNGTIR